MTPTERTPLQLPDARVVASSAAVAVKTQSRKRVLILVSTILVIIITGAWGFTVYRSSNSAHAATSQDAFVCDDTKQDAGYIKLPNKKDDRYFYWFFESRRSPASDPLVVWLQGGAGCSSLVGLLTENGPCHVLPSLTTTLNPYSWTNEANVIWLDQPTDTGYSYGPDEDLDRGEDDVQESIFWFLQGFLDKHPEFIGRPLFLAGESYAGHYIPAAAHYIWQQQLKESKTTGSTTVHPLNLQGIAMGNALVNLVLQTAHVLDMVSNSYNITLMNASELAIAQVALPECVESLEKCQLDTGTCTEAVAFCAEKHLVPFRTPNRNQHDIRMECEQAECYEMSSVTAYLNSAPVRAHLNVTEDQATTKQWEECSAKVSLGFAQDIVKPFDSYVADLLDNSDIRVLVYAGDADLVCNWHGCLAWMLALDWQHKDEFNAAEERAFVVTQAANENTNEAVTTNAGTVRAFKTKLTFVRMFNAGHMVPRDQPAVASEMLNRFLRNDAL